ncbi:MAG TPA: hypothetical protein VKB46_00040 [Pyrinomonadaceae bacterium]|nr:hypothetical protein [Pyrinomonadaceae bacterium]
MNIVLLACLLLTSLAVFAQEPSPTPTPGANLPPGGADEKSTQIINHAIEVLGGPAYLNVKTMVGRGFYTSFKDGISQIPARFLDYLAYPDHERTEFTGDGIKTIQTNAGATGWLFDGAVKTITDQGPTQVEEFKQTMRTSLENLLRGWYQKEGGKVTYVGRREAGLAKRNETVRLTYPNGFWIEYEFGAQDKLPAKIIYKRTRKNPDTGDEVETTEEDHLLKPIAVQGITAAWIIDHFVDGHQSSRINYESVQYNQTLPDSLFAKPADVKSIK